GSLAFPLPANTNLKRPKNRNLNIPVPAKDLGGGKSVYAPPSGFSVVFSNDSRSVVKKCNVVTNLSSVNSESDLTGCTTYDGYVLAGYVSKTMSSFPTNINLDGTDLATRLK